VLEITSLGSLLHCCDNGGAVVHTVDVCHACAERYIPDNTEQLLQNRSVRRNPTCST
jgi:hypothetical protein